MSPGIAEKLELTTVDGRKLSAVFRSVENPAGWLILVHMMPATKESWDAFAFEMRKSGYSSIAFDLCGHGESEGGPDGYKNFSDAGHQDGIKDIEAAWEFLKSDGALQGKTFLVGASIGANLSLKFLSDHSDIGGGILLSPGNYKGIDSGELIKRLDKDQKIIFAASKSDERSAGNSSDQNREYYDSAAQVKNKHLILFEGAGHGTGLFLLENEYNLIEAIKKFIEYGTIS